MDERQTPLQQIKDGLTQLERALDWVVLASKDADNADRKTPRDVKRFVKEIYDSAFRIWRWADDMKMQARRGAIIDWRREWEVMRLYWPVETKDTNGEWGNSYLGEDRGGKSYVGKDFDFDVAPAKAYIDEADILEFDVPRVKISGASDSQQDGECPRAAHWTRR